VPTAKEVSASRGHARHGAVGVEGGHPVNTRSRAVERDSQPLRVSRCGAEKRDVQGHPRVAFSSICPMTWRRSDCQVANEEKIARLRRGRLVDAARAIPARAGWRRDVSPRSLAR
jgi:hypothetical protein